MEGDRVCPLRCRWGQTGGWIRRMGSKAGVSGGSGLLERGHAGVEGFAPQREDRTCYARQGRGEQTQGVCNCWLESVVIW